jgi:predicted ferric reductase
MKIRGAFVCVVLLTIPAILFRSVPGPSSALVSQYIGASALIAMALSQIMATRARFVEPIFGPLDHIYVLHKWLGICALIALFLHDNIDPEIKALGEGNWLSEFGEELGELGYNGLIVLVAITLLRFIPYRIWYWTHRVMGVCFVFGALHFATAIKPFSNLDALGLYILAFCALGIVSYIYVLLPRSWRRGFDYEVSSIERAGNAHAITLNPVGQPLRHKAGQFAFFTFRTAQMGETHPFTISSAPQADGKIRISVGNLGDYTNKLASSISIGTTLRVQGPFGGFTMPRGSKRQIWIAGGIGITPFLSWLETAAEKGPKVDLIYTYRGEETAAHLEDVKTLVQGLDRVSLHLIDTSIGPRLSPDALAEIANGEKVKYSYCGPKELREALKKSIGFGRLNCEEFEIRTGLPIPKNLGLWVKSQISKTEIGQKLKNRLT